MVNNLKEFLDKSLMDHVKEMTVEDFMENEGDPVRYAINLANSPVGIESSYRKDTYVVRFPITDGILSIICAEKGIFKKKVIFLSVGIERGDILYSIKCQPDVDNLFYELKLKFMENDYRHDLISKPFLLTPEKGRRKIAEILLKLLRDDMPYKEFLRRCEGDQELQKRRLERRPEGV